MYKITVTYINFELQYKIFFQVDDVSITSTAIWSKKVTNQCAWNWIYYYYFCSGAMNTEVQSTPVATRPDIWSPNLTIVNNSYTARSRTPWSMFHRYIIKRIREKHQKATLNLPSCNEQKCWSRLNFRAPAVMSLHERHIRIFIHWKQGLPKREPILAFEQNSAPQTIH